MTSMHTRNLNIERLPEDCPDRIKGLAQLAARAAYLNRADNIEILEITNLCSYADYFVVATGRTRRQMRAIANHVELMMEANNYFKLGIEGAGDECGWMLLDYGDIIVQLFDEQARTYYRLEELWDEAPRLSFEQPALGAEPEEEKQASDLFWN